jgi:hypothetical protein
MLNELTSPSAAVSYRDLSFPDRLCLPWHICLMLKRGTPSAWSRSVVEAGEIFPGPLWCVSVDVVDVLRSNTALSITKEYFAVIDISYVHIRRVE